MNALTLSRFGLGLVWVFLGQGACTQGQPAPASRVFSPDDSLAVVETVTAFMEAIENADMDRYLATMTEDATMFFPFAPRRADSREEIAAVFGRIFERLRQSNGPPYLQLDPVGMRVQMVDDTIAIATWHFDRADEVGRRTAALRKEQGRWYIVSFHASRMDKPTP